jgi:hypothetical protein
MDADIADLAGDRSQWQNHHRRLLERPRDGELDKGPRHQAGTGRSGHDERPQKDAALGELTELAEALAGSRLGR